MKSCFQIWTYNHNISMYKWRTNTKELILKHFKGNWGKILVLNKQTCMFIYHSSGKREKSTHLFQ